MKSSDRARAFLFAVPVSALIMQRWLQGYAYHIPLYWWVFALALLIVLAVTSSIVLARSWRAAKENPAMSMTEATEHVARHKQLRTEANRILTLPLIALVVWTILIASDFALNLPIIALTVFSMGVGVALGITQQRANKKRLDEVLQQIEKLRG